MADTKASFVGTARQGAQNFDCGQGKMRRRASGQLTACSMKLLAAVSYCH